MSENKPPEGTDIEEPEAYVQSAPPYFDPDIEDPGEQPNVEDEGDPENVEVPEPDGTEEEDV